MSESERVRERGNKGKRERRSMREEKRLRQDVYHSTCTEIGGGSSGLCVRDLLFIGNKKKA